MKVRKAIIPAAGLGTRFLPATKAQPKEMLSLVDKPIIQYGVEEAMNSGCDQIIMGSHGRTALGGLLLGSVAMKVLHLTDIPVTLVK